MASDYDNTLSGFTDAEADERAYWRRVEQEALTLCDPLARMIGHKKICAAVDVSMGQLTRELSPAYENRLSLAVSLYVLRESQNEKLGRVIVVDGAGCKTPEWQKRRATPEEELKALREECRESGAVGQMLLDRAQRRARGSR